MVDQPSARPGLSRRTFLRVGGAGLSAAAAPGLLSACSGGGGGSDNPDHALKGVKPLTLAAPKRGVHYPPGYVGPKARSVKPIHDGSKTFRIVVPQDATNVGDWSKNQFTRWLEKRTGVKVSYEAIPIFAPDGSHDLTKVNAMLSSGDLPDAFLGVPFTSAQIALYGQQGLFQPLNSYIATYAPVTRQSFSDYPAWRPLITAPDGKLYQMKDLVDCYHCRISGSRAFVNREYVEAVGGQVPTSTDDLRELLRLFKAKDPTPKKNIIPFAASVGNVVDGYIMNSFLYNPGSSTTWLRLTDSDKVEFVADKDQWRDGLRYLRQLHDDGTLTREVFTRTDDDLLAAGNQGRLGFVRGYFWGVFINIEYTGRQQWKDYVPVYPLKGPGGVQFAPWDYYLFNGATSFCITKKCANPEILVQWADAQMDLEIGTSAGLGPLTTANWGYCKPGQRGIDGQQAIYYQRKYPPPVGFSWGNNLLAYQSNDSRLAVFADPENPDFEKPLYEASTGYKKYAQPQKMQLPPLIYPNESASEATDTATSLQSYVAQNMAKFAIGELDVNSNKDWQNYVSSFKKIGLSRFIDINQQAYDKRPR